MISGGWGRIVNISSVSALRPKGNAFIYSITKGANIALTAPADTGYSYPGVLFFQDRNAGTTDTNKFNGGADMDLYRATRSLEGQPRWQLAARDADIAQGDLLRDFACSVGIDLGTAEAPATRKVLTRASADLFPLVGASKDFYKRPRPYLVENRPLCIVPTEDLTRGGSYPSGHSAAGWLYALLLAETVPGAVTYAVNRPADVTPGPITLALDGLRITRNERRIGIQRQLNTPAAFTLRI